MVGKFGVGGKTRQNKLEMTCCENTDQSASSLVKHSFVLAASSCPAEVVTRWWTTRIKTWILRLEQLGARPNGSPEAELVALRMRDSDTVA